MFLDCAEEFDKFGATIKANNGETNKVLLENTTLSKQTKKYLIKKFEDKEEVGEGESSWDDVMPEDKGEEK